MARIPAEVVERLKTEISLQRLAEARGVELKRHGADLIGRCPFHDDKTPSLVITPGKNLWHCLGACQAGGTVIDWVMRAEGVSFRHAVELLQNDHRPLAAAAETPKHSRVKKLAMPLEPDAQDAQLLSQVIEYYHQSLLQSPEAMGYLEKRGIASSEGVRTFKLGYANRTLGYRLPDATRVEGAQIRGRLQRIGLWRESGHEHFNGSIVVPIVSASGEITGVYGRKIHDHLRPGTPYHLYLPGPHRGVWNAAALSATQEVILCEALIDALTFWCAGYRHVTSAYGVEGFTADHLSTFKQHRIERVLIAYDRDEAGDHAAEKLAQRLIAEGLDCYRIEFPKGMDANEYALKVGPADKSLGVAIRAARWLGKGAAPCKGVAPCKGAAPCGVAQGIEAAPVMGVAAPASIAPPPASPIAPAPTQEPPCEVNETEIIIVLGDRRYRVRGLLKNLSLELMKVNVMVSREERFHLDTFDFYAARARAAFATQAAVELGVSEEIVKHDLGRVLLKLEALQTQNLNSVLAPKAPATPKMSAEEEAAALALLRAPDLIERIVTDFDTCGLIGERTNKLIGYLAAVSRKLDRPLGIVIQSSSAAGKTSLLDAVLAFLPQEDRVKYSAMTGQSLFYMGETNLKHKVLAIVEEEGASRASYALKLLQSEGELTIASTGKDPQSGNLITQEYRVEGPVALLLTTTARDLDEELLNRCLVLAVDESREQTQAVHRLQRERRTLAGLHAKYERAHLRMLHQNAQRLLKAVEVLNPYAKWLTFPDQTTRLRRDHEKYLTLIDTIAFLHQHQRVLCTAQRGQERIEYIEASLDDIALANALAHEVLGRSLDELPPQTRRLIKLIDRFVAEQCAVQQIRRADYHFSRRVLREAIGWGDTQLKVHLARLVELEYLLPHRITHGAFEYELVYERCDESTVHFPGLIDVEVLRSAHGLTYDAERSGSQGLQSGSGRGAVGLRSGGGRESENASTSSAVDACEGSAATDAKKHLSRSNGVLASYPHASAEAQRAAGPPSAAS